MSTDPGLPTLDQLRILLAIAETGSFGGAARALNRAPSVISYAITNLEAQLGLALFDREGLRQPRLTQAGRMVLAEAQDIAAGVDRLRARARSLGQGLEPELHLVVDVLAPQDEIVALLAAFRDRFPTVALHLHAEALGAVTRMVQERRAAIGIGGPLAGRAGMATVALGTVALIPVAAPGHPLAAGPMPPGEAARHVQLVLTDRSDLTAGRDFAVLAPRNWRLADLGWKHRLLLAGTGWGNMPEPMVRADLAAGRLVQLRLADGPGEAYQLDAMYPADQPPGPAGAWLIAELGRRLG